MVGDHESFSAYPFTLRSRDRLRILTNSRSIRNVELMKEIFKSRTNQSAFLSATSLGVQALQPYGSRSCRSRHLPSPLELIAMVINDCPLHLLFLPVKRMKNLISSYQNCKKILTKTTALVSRRSSVVRSVDAKSKDPVFDSRRLSNFFFLDFSILRIWR